MIRNCLYKYLYLFLKTSTRANISTDFTVVIPFESMGCSEEFTPMQMREDMYQSGTSVYYERVILSWAKLLSLQQLQKEITHYIMHNIFIKFKEYFKKSYEVGPYDSTVKGLIPTVVLNGHYENFFLINCKIKCNFPFTVSCEPPASP